MNYKFPVIGLCAAFLVSGTVEPLQKIEIANTEKADLPANGTLRFENSIGELSVEGWDQPGVEITTIKSSQAIYTAEDKTRAESALGRVKVTTKRDGNDVVVTTEYPTHRKLSKATFKGEDEFELEYRIRAPRNARLVVNHQAGEIHIDDLTGNIHVTDKKGEITLRLEGDGARSIDAHTSFGSVNSDFPGTEKPNRWRVGHDYVQKAASPSQDLFLRVGYGDIVLVKAR